MFRVLNVCFCLWYLPSFVVGEELVPPQDVTLITFNTNYTLNWNWQQSLAESQFVTFTVQYVGKYKLQYKKKSPNWATVCNETPHTSCDLTSVGLHYLGMYMLRVRANVNKRHSDWVLKEFCPDKDAVLGPPSRVNLSMDDNNLEISISEPVTSNNITMRNYIPSLRYHIVYWERSADTQTQMLTSDSTLVYLSAMKAWTYYCVSVQSKYDFYNKSSIFTSPQCIQTEGNVPWWQIFFYFLGSLLACFLVVLLLFCTSFWCYRTIKATLYPSNQLPPIFKKYLCKSPGSDVPGLLTPDSEFELQCERVTICADPTILELSNPPPAALLVPPLGPDPDIRHNHRDSSSGDSGVYSTGDSFSVQHSSTSHSYTGVKDIWQDPVDLKQVKMQSLAPGLKGQLLITDEGIGHSETRLGGAISVQTNNC